MKKVIEFLKSPYLIVACVVLWIMLTFVSFLGISKKIDNMNNNILNVNNTLTVLVDSNKISNDLLKNNTESLNLMIITIDKIDNNYEKNIKILRDVFILNGKEDNGLNEKPIEIIDSNSVDKKDKQLDKSNKKWYNPVSWFK